MVVDKGVKEDSKERRILELALAIRAMVDNLALSKAFCLNHVGDLRGKRSRQMRRFQSRGFRDLNH